MTEEITADEYNAMQGRRGNKYGARTCVEDGYTFASQAERRRYRELKLMELAGEIQELRVHPRYELNAYQYDGKPVKIGHFTPDFFYENRDGDPTVEDVKGGRATKTEAYSLRKRLFEACYGIKLTEIGV